LRLVGIPYRIRVHGLGNSQNAGFGEFTEKPDGLAEDIGPVAEVAA
jgi:hypothetical protein